MKWVKAFSVLAALGLWQPSVTAAELPAIMDWGQRVELGTLVSGLVSEVPVSAGQRVERGEVLLRLDPRGFRARLAGAEAAVARARAGFEEARREDERAAELYERTVLSDRGRQLAAIGLEEARSELREAEARRVQAGLDHERSVIRAPFSGVVVRVDAAPGQVIVSQLQSRPLVVLADDRQMQAVASIPAEQIERLGDSSGLTVRIGEVRLEGGTARVGLEPEKPVSGQRSGVSYALRVPVQVDPGTRLRSGQAATIQIPD